MKYDKIVGLKKQQEKENLEIIQREIDAMLRRKERISITALAKYAGVDRSYFYRNLQAKQMVEEAQLKQGECYNPKKAIFDRATEEVNKQLKRQMILYKRRIKELELQIECKRSIASTCSSTPFSAIIVSHYTESKKLSTQLF